MKMRFAGYVLVGMLLCGAPTRSQEERALHYELQEELRVGTRVGDILHDSGLSRKYSDDVIKNLQFSFLSEPRVRLSIGGSDGVLRTSGRIDRDKICPHKELCQIDLDIAVRPVQYFQIIKASVEILDINDNYPAFPDSEITHPILESATIGSSFVIPSAIDEDSPAYGVERYELTQSSSDKFELKVTPKLDGSKDVRLVLRGEMDREVEDRYHVHVLAYDAGSQPGKLSLTINVLDSNDNDPVFTNNTYHVTIPENMGVRDVVLQVHAKDKDSGANGRVVYAFSARTQTTYGSLFGINNKTGEIFVKGRLDHETVSIINLIVTAADQGPDSLPAEATVVVHILDLNDNPPQITVNTLAASATNRAEIAEDSPTGTFVAHVTVTDPDSGNNGRFNCSLNDNTFSLVQRYETEYQIITAAALDREKSPQYNLALVCRDMGSESLVAIKHIQVIVTDTNDHTPVFQKQKYTANLIENNFVGATLVTVNASDRDSGANADIRYSISREAGNWFHVNPRSGVITAKESIDRERNDQFSFYVLAADRGRPAKTGSALVTVTIEDVNDESPRFSKPGGYTMTVEENKPPGEEVGTVSADDMDGPEFNMFTFSLEAIDRASANTFYINPRTGLITTKVKLDREERLVYYLKVMASDDSVPPKSASVSVTVYVNDVNDNKPEFDYPTDQNNTISISNKVPVGHVITKVRGHDKDDDANAKLSYIFFSGNEERIFLMDEETGSIEVTTELSEISYHLYELHIMAKDHGIPERYDVATLNIIVNKTIPFPLGGSHNSILSGHNFVIVISLACACAVITIILVVAIILIRRQDRGKRIHKYNCRMEALRMLTAKETLSPSEESTPCKEPPKIGGNGDIQRNGRPVHAEIVHNGRQGHSHGGQGQNPHLAAQGQGHGRPWVMPQKEAEVHNLLHMWPGRPDDGESLHSGDGSNTDSGRGASEEGENAHKLDAHQAGVQGRSPRPDPQAPHQGGYPRGQAGGRDPSHPGYYVAPHRPPSSHSYSSNPPRLQSFNVRERAGTSRSIESNIDHVSSIDSTDSVVHAKPARVLPPARSSSNPRGPQTLPRQPGGQQAGGHHPGGQHLGGHPGGPPTLPRQNGGQGAAPSRQNPGVPTIPRQPSAQSMGSQGIPRTPLNRQSASQAGGHGTNLSRPASTQSVGGTPLPRGSNSGGAGPGRSGSQIPRIPNTIQRTSYTVPPGTSTVGTTSAPPYKSVVV